MTKWTLFAALAGSGTGAAVVRLPDGRYMLVQAIEREDGSGSSFNVRGVVDGVVVTVYLRTAD